jgi:hypothetical protein
MIESYDEVLSRKVKKLNNEPKVMMLAHRKTLQADYQILKDLIIKL